MVAEAFRRSGATVRYPFQIQAQFPGATGAGGYHAAFEQIDGALYGAGLTCLIEAKDLNSEVDFGLIAHLQARLMQRPTGTLGLFFSRKDYTTPTLYQTRLRMQPTVLLWFWNEFEAAITQGTLMERLIRKYRHAVEEGVPYLNTNLEENQR